MTIKDIAERLSRCAADKCDGCKYVTHGLACQSDLIQELGNEIRKIVAEEEDDVK